MTKHSRQSTFTCIFVVISALSGPHLSLVFSIIAVSEIPQSKIDCHKFCGNTLVPYPFYIKPRDNNNSDFGLDCYNNSTVMITLNKVSYTVTNMESDSIIINPNQTSCDINLQHFTIDGVKSYAISASNIIQLSDCKNSRNCSLTCNFPRGNGEQCKFVDTCCHFLENGTLWQPGDTDFTHLSQMQCTGFTSWVISSIVPTYHVENGLKLEWAIPGNCATFGCDVNAICFPAENVKDGVRCACKDRYIGDGFIDGTGCTRGNFLYRIAIYFCTTIFHKSYIEKPMIIPMRFVFCFL
ncbi:hypothetical protein SUGI_0687800 [Cryptomeria japonica]|nr:hypothetical protein SUGI_0687800 [Cryptomeria japonica]